MKNYDYSIVILNNNSDNLLNCIRSIANQNYDLSKVEVIIETIKLSKDIINEINKLNLDIVLRNHKEINVSVCYNDALKICSGEYIHFINSNIIFNDEKSLLEEKNANKNIICCNINYFEKDTEQNSKYLLSSKKNVSIYLEKNGGQINICLESYVFNRDVLKNISFDDMFYDECKIKFLIDVLIKNKEYYNLGEITLNSYSPFEDNTSKNAIQYDINWYNTSLRNWITYLEQFKVIPVFVQEIIMYIIYSKYNCNLNDRNKKVLIDENLDDFIKHTKELLNYLDDNIILQRNLDSELKKINHRFEMPKALKLYYFKLKDKKKNEVYVSDSCIYEKNQNSRIKIIDLLKEKVNIYAINYNKGKLVFDCTLGVKDYLEENDICLRVEYAGKKIETVKYDIYNLQKVFGITFNKKYTFQFEIDIKNNFGDLKVYLIYQDKEYQLSFDFVKVQARLNNSKRSYWNYKDFIIENKKNKLIISKSSKLKVFKLEVLFILSKLKNEKNKIRVCKLSFLRILYYLTKPFMKNKHIWITFDKLYKAGDNGEYIYQYCLKNNKNIYYIIRKDAPDYERLVKQNKKHILVFNSLKAKLFCLHSEAILDTHANVISYCGFDGLARDFAAGLFNAEIICIQHGLTMQDIAQFQNRLFDNIKLYCCASKYEMKNISKEIYGYKKEQIKLTGLARYDGLKSNDKRFILITPTWRKNVVNSSVAHKKKKHNDNFKNSEYFKIYNSLINNKKLIKCAKENNYRIIYLLHPAMSGQFEDFDRNDYVEVVPATSDINYEKILTEASLMVTDYSGVQYDFGYQRKALIYYHPDKLPPHYDVGMMNYNNIGFGLVCKTEQELVDELCNSIKNKCKIEKKYEDRDNCFFEYSDYNNCMRIVNEVEKYLKDEL